MTPTLLSLPPELLHAIAENVTKKDLKRLRLTCKLLGDILEPIPLSPFGEIKDLMEKYLGILSALRSLQSVTWSGPQVQWIKHGHMKIIMDFLASLPSLHVFEEPLTRHAKTLEELDVEAGRDDLWCFGTHNISALSSCTGLKKLGVSVAEVDLPIFWYFNRYSTTLTATPQNAGIIENLLEMASTHMPRLSQLSISLSAMARMQRSPGMNSFMPVIAYLLAYSIPPSLAAIHLPTVVTDSRKFVPIFPSLSPDEAVGGKKGRYTEVKGEEPESTDDASASSVNTSSSDDSE
ncbi:hypothetical protein M413DRAFT_25441 [Hebeloma cylindrosporum]|uniref:F-box domain-containing protein n=1 Tax=Hebeloma cylindrosporum TaxID=76867 RepID=A0A0C2Y235_HEBCY|nr:hypothetical protein M413DRAFT_25441 [Hebeloma cylindrosporum h7]